jgi:hypothetical protein
MAAHSNKKLNGWQLAAAKQRPLTLGARLDAKKRLPPLREIKVAAVVPLNLTLAELRADQCRYPYGGGNYRFCGLKKMDGKSYCPEHFRLCTRQEPLSPIKLPPRWR